MEQRGWWIWERGSRSGEEDSDVDEIKSFTFCTSTLHLNEFFQTCFCFVVASCEINFKTSVFDCFYIN